jgi:hypothetical protein
MLQVGVGPCALATSVAAAGLLCNRRQRAWPKNESTVGRPCHALYSPSLVARTSVKTWAILQSPQLPPLTSARSRLILSGLGRPTTLPPLYGSISGLRMGPGGPSRAVVAGGTVAAAAITLLLPLLVAVPLPLARPLSGALPE